MKHPHIEESRESDRSSSHQGNFQETENAISEYNEKQARYTSLITWRYLFITSLGHFGLPV